MMKKANKRDMREEEKKRKMEGQRDAGRQANGGEERKKQMTDTRE